MNWLKRQLFKDEYEYIRRLEIEVSNLRISYRELRIDYIFALLAIGILTVIIFKNRHRW